MRYQRMMLRSRNMTEPVVSYLLAVRSLEAERMYRTVQFVLQVLRMRTGHVYQSVMAECAEMGKRDVGAELRAGSRTAHWWCLVHEALCALDATELSASTSQRYKCTQVKWVDGMEVLLRTGGTSQEVDKRVETCKAMTKNLRYTVEWWDWRRVQDGIRTRSALEATAALMADCTYRLPFLRHHRTRANTLRIHCFAGMRFLLDQFEHIDVMCPWCAPRSTVVLTVPHLLRDCEHWEPCRVASRREAHAVAIGAGLMHQIVPTSSELLSSDQREQWYRLMVGASVDDVGFLKGTNLFAGCQEGAAQEKQATAGCVEVSAAHATAYKQVLAILGNLLTVMVQQAQQVFAVLRQVDPVGRVSYSRRDAE